MADEQGGDRDGNVADLTVRILRDIRDELRGTNERLDATNERLDATNERLDATNERLAVGFKEVNVRLDRLSARIDNVLVGPMGESVRDLRARVGALEEWRSAVDSKKQ